MPIRFLSLAKASGLIAGLLLSCLIGLHPTAKVRSEGQDLPVGRVSPLPDLPTLWRSVDAVVYLRIQEGLTTRSLPEAAAEYKASVLEVFRRYRGEPREATIRFLQSPAAARHEDRETVVRKEAPFEPGEELIAFLWWNESAGAFEGSVIVPVREGQVRSSGVEELLKGMSLEEFLKKLRAMME